MQGDEIVMAQIYPFQTHSKRHFSSDIAQQKKDLFEFMEANKRLTCKSNSYKEEEFRYTDMTEIEWKWLKKWLNEEE